MKKVIVHEGRTTKHPERDDYMKSYIGLEYDLPDEVDEATIARTMIHMRSLIRQELGAPDVAQAAQFNPEDLMKHDWKGKKDGEGGYAKGSLSWGWDFVDKFKRETVEALVKGPVSIDQYVFSLNDTKTLVQAKKRK